MDPPQLTGFVIITLPPADDPSKGKTITAFTLSDSPSSILQQQPQFQHQQQQQQQLQYLPSRSPPDPERNFFGFRRRALFSIPRIVLGFLGITLLACFLWSSVYSDTFLELRGRQDDRKVNSFLFTLYPKKSVRHLFHRDVELKLGRFVQRDAEDTLLMIGARLKQQQSNKLLSSSVASVDPSTIFPIRGNMYPDGLYYALVLVGNPPRPYYLDMDTGSDLTWIQCDAPCVSCAKGPHPYYKPAKGNIVPHQDSLCTEVQTSQNHEQCESCQQCDYEIEYADRSSSMGVLAKDELQLMIANGTEMQSNFVFGCAYDQQGQLSASPADTDGILGLGRAKISLPSQLASQGIIHNVVGHCIRSDVDGGGYMFLGDDFVPRWGMTWVPMLNRPSINFYHSEIVKISYGSAQLSLGGPDNSIARIAFDSGSSYTYFTKEAYSGLVASFKDFSTDGLIRDESDSTLPICWRPKFQIRSVKDVKRFFKPLNLQFGSGWWIVSTKLSIPPEGYLVISDKGNVCLGVLDGSEVHDGSTIILGDISLRGQLIVYDNINQKIGWIQSDCVKAKRLKSFPFF
ncbi:aspartyl protease APCB1 isoform X1 [Telopea speciosissima]|uniref:aspartyl protease APCB1 isoform X1 n=1 Tax=Telopea speciosissima TaxID=54955 RepID=UPI001CC60F0F|nr:aspartyl protease APCB1 isoform X1 [Telopea speciosissima]